MNRSIFAKLAAFAGVALFTSSLVGCGPDYDRTEISGVKGQGVLDNTLSTQKLEVAEGLIVTAQIVVWNDDNEQMSLDVRSKNPDIVEIDGVVNARNYAFLGKKAGSTEIQFLADGDVVLTIPATVVAQPDPAPSSNP